MRLTLVISACLLCVSCTDRKEQLQQVARDWCLTITASQVMPVYPLTEDLQPGDVFLVRMPIEEQRQRFDDNGFLPLDFHIARLTPKRYPIFYKDMFVVPLGTSSVNFTRELQRGTSGAANWSAAPAAAFPSYSVSVSRSGGLNAGIPLSGIPIGMSLLDAEEATATVIIKDASTLGVDVVPLSEQLDVWAAANEAYLRPYARAVTNENSGRRRQKRNYLRTVSRIYVTGGVDVSVADARSGSAGIDAGRPRPVDLLYPRAPAGIGDVNSSRVENSRRAIAAQNAMLAESMTPSLPAGSNEDATAAEMDARTKAKEEALKAERVEREKKLQEATTEVESKRTSATEAQKELDEANANLAAARKELAEVPASAKQEEVAAAQKAVTDAEATVAAKQAAKPIQDLQQAIGKADAARLAIDQLGTVVPGASVRITSASSRYVTLRQDFNPPLIIGYVGFDREILRDGAEGKVYLGPPIATEDQVFPDRAGAVQLPEPVSVVPSDNSPRAVEVRRAIRKWHANGAEKLDQLNEKRLALFPRSEHMGLGEWLQTTSADETQAVAEALEIKLPD